MQEMEHHNIEKIRNNTHTVQNYLAEVSVNQPKFIRTLSNYVLDKDVTGKLADYSDDIVIVAFSAEWCKDCHRNIPILHHISDTTGIEVRVFGHLMRDVKNKDKHWRIPPSPVEVEEFNVGKIPLIVILDMKGMQLGQLVENPPEGKTLEETMLKILES